MRRISRPQTCELLLGGAGLLGDVSVRSCPLSWVALEEDLLSLEAAAAFKELVVDGDTSCLHSIALALTELQFARGAIPHIKAKGHWAVGVQKILSRMRREAGAAAPAPGTDGSIDTLILIDRSVDMVTPMCTQLTYEGLLDEVLGLSCGQIRTTAPAAAGAVGGSPAAGTSGRSERKITGLNSSDTVFVETRDRFYLGTRRWLNETLRSIQQFRDAGMEGADISSLKGFVADLRDKFVRIPLHTSLVEQLGEAVKAPEFAARMRVEAALLNEDPDLAGIEDLMAGGEGALPVLRLLCLYCAVHGGVPKRHFDTLRRDLLNTYGHEHLLTLGALGKAGLFQRKEGKKAVFPGVKDAFRVLMHEGEVLDESDPADIHFAYAGYAPLSVRVVQQAVGAGWAAAEAAMAALPGPSVEILQTTDDQGLPVDKPEGSSGAGNGRTGVNGGVGGSGSGRRTVMVVFIGGVTHAEVSALRFLSRKGLVGCDFVVVTTKVVTGSSLLASMMAPSGT